MEIKPVKKLKPPKYATLEYFIKNPELLSKSIPERWLRNRYAAASLAAFVFFGNASSAQKSKPQTMLVEKQNSPKKQKQESKRKKSQVKIAPIFAHGNGTGSTGCVVMSPPVFISEDEAYKIISEAFKAHDIELSKEGCPVIRFRAPALLNYCDDDKNPKADVSMKMDAYNAEYNLAVQFISASDFYKYSFKSKFICISSVQAYDLKLAAELLLDALKKKSKSNVVVFYDPIKYVKPGDSYKDWEQNQKIAKEEAQQLLLAQVNDFIAWMKEELIVE